MESSKNLSGTAKQTASIIAGKIIALLATFAVPLFLTRYLSKSEYGIYSQFYVVVFFCTSFFCMGVQTNLYYYYPTSTYQNRKSLIIQTILFLVFFAVAAVSILNLPIFSKYLIGEGELCNYKTYILIGIILLMPVNIIEPLYIVRKDNFTSVFYPPSEVILRLTLVIGLVLIRPGLNSLFSGVIVSAAICFIFAIMYSFKEIKIKDIKVNIFNSSLAKEQLKYSLPFGLAVSLNTLAVQFDKILCISFLSPSNFATYSVAFYGIPGVQQVYDSLSKVYLIKMTLKHQEGKAIEISEIYKSLVSKTYSFSLPSLFIVSLYARKIIVFLFTSKYIDAVPLFRAYLFSFLIFMLGAGLILRATDKTVYALKSYVYSSVITIPTTYFLIKHYGVWGAMSGAILSIIIPRILILMFEIKFINCTVKNFFPWKNFGLIALISLISIIPFTIIEHFFNYGIVVMALMAMLYLIIVSILEIKYNLFVIDSSFFRNKMQDIVLKYELHKKYMKNKNQ